MAKLFAKKQEDDDEDDYAGNDMSDVSDDDADDESSGLPSMKGNGGISPSKHFMKSHGKSKKSLKKKHTQHGKRGLSGFLAKMKGK